MQTKLNQYDLKIPKERIKKLRVLLGIKSCKNYCMVETLTKLETNSDADPIKRGIARTQEQSPFLK